VWAGVPAPPINSAIALLPKGCTLHLYMVSASGKSSEERVTMQLQGKGYAVAGYEDIRK